MIRSEGEYRKAVEDLAQAHSLLEHEREHWLAQGLAEDEASEMLQPLRLRMAELSDRIELFERVRSGDLTMFNGLEDLGRALIAARIARGLTQRELARLLGVHESQVSRDERNEYCGIGAERLRALMAVLQLSFEGHFRLEPTVIHPRLVRVVQPPTYQQAATLALAPEEVERFFGNAVA